MSENLQHSQDSGQGSEPDSPGSTRTASMSDLGVIVTSTLTVHHPKRSKKLDEMAREAREALRLGKVRKFPE